jgi:helix-turn-helix protein
MRTGSAVPTRERMPSASEPTAFGPLLRRLRIAAELTQEALAERAGLGTRSIQQWVSLSTVCKQCSRRSH